MEFKKYNSIENTYRKKAIQQVYEYGFNGGMWEATNKIHGCLEGNQLIDTLELGIQPIRNLVENKDSIGELHVKSFNHTLNEIEYKLVTNVSEQDNINNWYEIELETGEKLILTETHKIFLPDLNCYRELKEIKEGDNVLIE